MDEFTTVRGLLRLQEELDEVYALLPKLGDYRTALTMIETMPDFTKDIMARIRAIENKIDELERLEAKEEEPERYYQGEVYKRDGDSWIVALMPGSGLSLINIRTGEFWAPPVPMEHDDEHNLKYTLVKGLFGTEVARFHFSYGGPEDMLMNSENV